MMTDEILTQLRAVLAFVNAEREMKFRAYRECESARAAEAALTAAIAGVERLAAELRASPTEWAELCEKWKAERDAAIAERDESKLAVGQLQTIIASLAKDRDAAIAERDVLLALPLRIDEEFSGPRNEVVSILTELRAALAKDTTNEK
jgi:hypothetical protein